MRLARLILTTIVVAVVLFSCAPRVHGSAFVKGAYYRLGEDDPGALAGQPGNSTTIDAYSDKLNLALTGSSTYSSDVPARTINSKLSMSFSPSAPGYYVHSGPLPTIEQGYALEAWAKPAASSLTVLQSSLIAYNGTPGDNGFGFYQIGDQFVARIGSFNRVLGPVQADTWHHLAYNYSLGTESYYYDGKLILETTKDPAALAPLGGFYIGGYIGDNITGVTEGFNGLLDDVRFQSYDPRSAGFPGPDPFLIAGIPEPTSFCLTLAGAIPLLLARRRSTRS